MCASLANSVLKMAGRNAFNFFFHEEFTEDVVKDQIVPNVVALSLDRQQLQNVFKVSQSTR